MGVSVPSHLLSVGMPIQAVSHPTEIGHLVVEVDDRLVVVAIIVAFGIAQPLSLQSRMAESPKRGMSGCLVCLRGVNETDEGMGVGHFPLNLANDGLSNKVRLYVGRNAPPALPEHLPKMKILGTMGSGQPVRVVSIQKM